MFISISHSNWEEMPVSYRSGCPRAMSCLPLPCRSVGATCTASG